MKKKIVAGFLCIIMIMVGIIGCGKTKSTMQENSGNIAGEITVITQRTDIVDTKFAEYKKEFEKKYPGTSVKFEAITDDLQWYDIRFSERIEGEKICQKLNYYQE